MSLCISGENGQPSWSTGSSNLEHRLRPQVQLCYQAVQIFLKFLTRDTQIFDRLPSSAAYTVMKSYMRQVRACALWSVLSVQPRLRHELDQLPSLCLCM